ncbi:MAG: ATP-dependent RNA helicase HrpA [Betaproteobacteria bacterium]|nr:ATP-dependent RNA helicase HrpA [Betaproteobacteria bacterium]
MSIEAPRAPSLRLDFPDSLPVSQRRHEIMQALQAHQVLIVCGETGSGKTTQLPKMALAIGRGAARAPGQRPSLIGHTQPRRIAASSVAKRIAEEMQTPLGEVVGYKVRFQDRLQPGARVKLMTDGILLAEAQGDPLLRAYDTIIVDEAHERSLNIDFLIGHLRQILPKRPDLKLIVTSATIDAERFAQHFCGPQGPAPVFMVSGRTYPVELRWRPFEESKERDLQDAITEAVDELWRGGAHDGDILVFLPGEREIREAADHLRQHLAPHPVLRSADILPLFARLSQPEQDRVFSPSNGRRIVLSTNVAETSLTVPGIRFVIDAGTARVKRYSYRHKVEQLQVEPISRAAAHQRAGRCGRVAAGVCIRLYDEESFAARPAFTEPEILRSSLASVILRMKSLGLGEVEDFPFLEAPPRKAIADGYALLAELGAVDDDHALTELGRSLARLPLDPRIGRMILSAREQGCLSEMLVIASAMSCQDVRDRPLEAQAAADAKHKPFDDERSEFMGTLRLWQWIEDGRGRGAAQPTHKLSNRQQEARLREHFINPRRVREWRDVHAQLHLVVAEHGWRLNSDAASYEQVHLSLLSGLLGNIGLKADDEDHYLGARGIKFWRHPGAHLSRKPGRWIMVAELVETTRLFGRGIAAIEPPWIVQMGGHLLKKQLLEPHWERKAGEVVAVERATLYGLLVYSNRRVSYSKVDPALAREIFIREALVGGDVPPDWDQRFAFLPHNRKAIRSVEALEHKSRRQDLLVDDALIQAYYDQHVGAEVCSQATLERWYRAARREHPDVLKLTPEELMRHEAAGITTQAFPKVVRLGGVDCPASYLHEPGDVRDGLTVTVPLYALNQVQEARCEWLVPGMLKDKVLMLCKTLHQKARSRLVPLPDFAAEFCELATFGDGSLMDALLKAVRERTQLAVQKADFKPEQLSAHLLMNLRVVDEHGRQLGMGRHVAGLKAQWGAQARGAFQALAALQRSRDTEPSETPVDRRSMATAVPGPAPAPRPLEAAGRPLDAGSRAIASSVAEDRVYTAWDFGELPELMEIRRKGQVLVGFPALVDQGHGVRIEVFDDPDQAQPVHRQGLRRLIALQIREPLKFLEKNIPELQRMAVAYMPLGTEQELREQIIQLALDRAFTIDRMPTDAESFAQMVEQGRPRLNLVAQEVARLAGQVLAEHAGALRKLRDARLPKEVHEDIQAHVQRLVTKRFLTETPWILLQHLPRYLKAVVMRVDKQRADPARDQQRQAEIRPLEQRWLRRLQELKGRRDERLEDFRWLLEELRVSLFAQELRTPQPVSVKRLEKVWAQMQA